MDARSLQFELDELALIHHVPGASIAVLADGTVTEAATGVINIETGVPTTPDTLFQIGSITKPWTATLVMQLVDAGLLDLDAPLHDLLSVGSNWTNVSPHISLRHLLSHTSGLPEDHFCDTGRGDDALAGYVESCVALRPTSRAGDVMSYCNTGYILAGRIIETITKLSWDEALEERLIRPLALTHTVTLPERALRFSVAHGHNVSEGTAELVPRWGLPRSVGPAGLICSTSREVLAFARMHMLPHRSVSSEQVLSTRAVLEMQTRHAEVPDSYSFGSHWGLGWSLFDWAGTSGFGHDGSTLGQAAFLRVVPDAGVAVALLTNGGGSRDLFQRLVGDLLQEVAGITLSSPPEPTPGAWPNVYDIDGTYEHHGQRIIIRTQNDAVTAQIEDTGELAGLRQPQRCITLMGVSGGNYVGRMPGARGWTPFIFFTTPDGNACLHLGGRANRRVNRDV